MAAYQTLCNALVTIIGASAGVQSAAGRATNLVVQVNQPLGAIPLPAVCFEVRRLTSQDADLLFTTAASGPTAHATAQALMTAVKAALTGPALEAAGVVAVPVGEGTDESVTEVGDLRERAGVDGIPDLQQADWSLPLLVLD